MRRSIAPLALLSFSFALALAGCGKDSDVAGEPAAESAAATTTPAPLPPPPNLVARSLVLIDHDSGRVLAGLDPDSRQEPASLTKLMTAYVVFHAL
jgi:D-alanyl-D-alanine carboxypeptidase